MKLHRDYDVLDEMARWERMNDREEQEAENEPDYEQIAQDKEDREEHETDRDLDGYL